MIDKETLDTLYKENSLGDIASLLGISKTTVRRWLIKYDIELKPPGFNMDFTKRANYSLSEKQKGFLVGTLLGDGHISVNSSGRSGRFETVHSIKQLDYVKYKKDLLGRFASKIAFGRARVKNKVHLTCGFKSFSHPEFLTFRELFYNAAREKIVKQEIAGYFNAFSFAILIMDDGTLKSKRNLILCTDCFDEESQLILLDLIREKFGIIGKVIDVQGAKKNIWFGKNETVKIKNLVDKHIIDSMKYKLVR